ncbi:MAG TPA: pseudouridine-5'-phosphate glycosidase [Patescibacteria group bacterium]|nr:pseudouridine-5'-phosphate glycosidase [Patescibacteria group bacterium]
MNRFTDYLDISGEVLSALRNYDPIVALESTIISHGMPYPDNIATALELEQIIRDNGATPATIAIIDGRIKIGITREELEILAKAKDVAKVSRRDIPSIIALGKSGATTVASTMIFAQLAGINVFATGGIGGVHRGAEVSFDISADLTELAQTNVAVVCAGVKSILDIGKTLEKLETLGVPVLGYQSEEFPSFYTRKSGFHVDYRFNTPKECAIMLKTKWDLNLDGGVVVANPIPTEYEANEDIINNAINQALSEAEKNHIKGKEVTPFMLAKVKELTGGESLEANIALVRNNAALAAQIAVEYCRLNKK